MTPVPNAVAPAGSRLAAVLEQARRRLPYPEEIEPLASPEALARLTETVMAQSGSPEVLAFARTMPSRQLMLVFPLLAAHSQRSELTDRLNAIIRERACASLLRVGYVTFQRHYPHPLLPPAIVAVWQILRIRDIPYEPILQDIVPLTGRSLLNRTVRQILDQNVAPARFLTAYRIDPRMAFGARLCALLFKGGDEALFHDSVLLFEQVLMQLEPAEQAGLVVRFLQLDKLPPADFDQYCQVVYDRFGAPSDGHPVWDHVRPQERARFATWVREATVGSHFRENRTAARFFLRYRRFFRSVQELDADTLVITFPEFTVTHSHRWPETAMYRSLSDRSAEGGLGGMPGGTGGLSLGGLVRERGNLLQGDTELGRDPGDSHPDISPADPRRPHRLPQEALRKSATDGQVLLLLDSEGMKQSAVFLEFALRGGRRHFG